jgi:hypothetical protein
LSITHHTRKRPSTGPRTTHGPQRRICGGSLENRRLLDWSTKPRPEARGRRRDPGAPRSFDVGGRVAGSRGLRREDAVHSDGVAVRWRGVLHDLFAPKGLYHNLSARGSVVFCLAHRGLIYISSRISRQTIHPDFFSFPYSIGLDFSSICKESDLRVNGSFQGCVDSPLVACWIFVSFSSYFRRFFMCGLFLRFWGIWVRICWWGSWIVASCIFVLYLDPQTLNSTSDWRISVGP